MANISAADPRAIAWEILRRVEETDAFADAVLGHRLAATRLDPRDRGLLTQLVYGTLAWRGFLDRAIEGFAHRPAAALDKPIRILLELALFQLFKLDRVPDYAVVNQAVELAKTSRGGRVAALVNAVLRRAAREGAAGVPLPDRARDPIGYLAASYSHPEWLVDRWVAQLGEEETEQLLRANNQPAPTVVRVNRRRRSRDEVLEAMRAAGVQAQPAGAAPDGIIVEGGSPQALPGYSAGEFSMQSEASQLATLLLGARPGDRVLDACAGSGGKATYIAEIMNDEGRIVAIDRHRHALRRLRDESVRLGLRAIHAVVADSTRPPAGGTPQFDRILLDAPCSGLGTLRQHPEIRWRRAPADVAACARLQRRLLAALLDQLRPGGVLVYATCTLLREENDDVVDAALAGRGDVARDMSGADESGLGRFADPTGAVRLFPHRQGLDGFFAVRLKRR